MSESSQSYESGVKWTVSSGLTKNTALKKQKRTSYLNNGPDSPAQTMP